MENILFLKKQELLSSYTLKNATNYLSVLSLTTPSCLLRWKFTRPCMHHHCSFEIAHHFSLYKFVWCLSRCLAYTTSCFVWTAAHTPFWFPVTLKGGIVRSVMVSVMEY